MSPKRSIKMSSSSSAPCMTLLEAALTSPRSLPRLIQTPALLTSMLQSPPSIINAAAILPPRSLSHLFSILHEERTNRVSILIFIERVLRSRAVREGGEDDWAGCLAFMISYDAIFDETAREGGVREEIVSVSLRIIEFLRNCATVRLDDYFGRQLKRTEDFILLRESSKHGQNDLLLSCLLTKRKRGEEIPTNDLQSEEEVVASHENKADSINNESEPSEKRNGIHDSDTDAVTIETPAPMIPPELKLSIQELRTSLLHLRLNPQNATNAELKSLSRQFTALLQTAVTDIGKGGSKGIQILGNAIGYGMLDNEKERKQQLAFTDTLMSLVSKSFVSEGTSTLRTCAFMRFCVLPLCIELDQKPNNANAKRNKPASRVLLTTLTSLAKTRPRECIDSILLPVLCHETDAGPTQCELLTRILKEKPSVFPKDCISYFIEQIVFLSSSSITTPRKMNMTEYSIPILTASLVAKPLLADETVRFFLRQIEYLLSGAISATGEERTPPNKHDWPNSMKLSAFFHSLVTKYGDAIQRLGSVEGLERNAALLKTFMKKTILGALKRL